MSELFQSAEHIVVLTCCNARGVPTYPIKDGALHDVTLSSSHRHADPVHHVKEPIIEAMKETIDRALFLRVHSNTARQRGNPIGWDLFEHAMEESIDILDQCIGIQEDEQIAGGVLCPAVTTEGNRLFDLSVILNDLVRVLFRDLKGPIGTASIAHDELDVVRLENRWSKLVQHAAKQLLFV